MLRCKSRSSPVLVEKFLSVLVGRGISPTTPEGWPTLEPRDSELDLPQYLFKIDYR